MTTSAPRDRWRWEQIGWVLVILAIGLRLSGLASLPFDQDELYTLRDTSDLGASAARSGLPGIAARPIYYLLQRPLLALLPTSELSLRILPFVFGALGVWITWRLAWRYVGPSAAVISGLLAAMSPWHLYASQFARYWTLIYLLAALAYLHLPRAMQEDRPQRYGAVAALLAVGVLTHPTFAFPMVGFVLGLHAMSSDGTLGWKWPTRRAWVFLWIPLAVVLGTYGGVLLAFGQAGAIGNGTGRGLDANLRILPAIVQWITPIVSMAAVVGTLSLLGSRADSLRRWGLLVLLGVVVGIGLLLAAAWRTDVYADYAMASLPLVFLAAGGMAERLTALVPQCRHYVTAACAALLVAGFLPETVSHLSDGTRFDYRTAYGWLKRNGSGQPVVGWPAAQMKVYGTGLESRELRYERSFLEDRLAEFGGFWLVASYHRRGLVLGERDVSDWIRQHCREVYSVEHPRLDYRRYRVEVQWCGRPSAAEPGGSVG